MTIAPRIEPDSVYFREDIARMWGYDYDEQEADDYDRERLRKWFHRNFLSKGLPVSRIGGRIVVHGQSLTDWIRFRSQVSTGEQL